MGRPKTRKPVTCRRRRCAKVFSTTPSRISYGHAKFCSKACYFAERAEPQTSKVCSLCQKRRPAAHFTRYVSRNGLVRLRAQCHACRRHLATAYVKRNAARIREMSMVRHYGITEAAYQTLLAAQERRCGICRGVDPGRGFKRLLVDHDHQSGHVRGLLCSACNSGIGRFRDDPSLLLAAAKYLLRKDQA